VKSKSLGILAAMTHNDTRGTYSMPSIHRRILAPRRKAAKNQTHFASLREILFSHDGARGH